jgi:hypothetical protein
MTYSTGMLNRHLKSQHPKVFEAEVATRVEKQLSSSDQSGSQQVQLGISKFIKNCPLFEDCLVKWMVSTYQPLQCVNEKSFQDMCKSLNKCAPIITRERIGSLVKEKYHFTKIKLQTILKNRKCILTTDSWTSISNTSYVTCTCHFIEQKTWTLHSIVMGLFAKDGGATATEVVRYVEQQMFSFDVQYKNLAAIVTDTEATMVAAGRLFVSNSIGVDGSTKWLGCIAHLLELVTGIAFTDREYSLETMKCCRALVQHFNSSSQALQILLAKQQHGRQVKPIQDVSTRWWSNLQCVNDFFDSSPTLD